MFYVEQEEDYRRNFRENLKSIRINFGYTQANLSLKANFDSTYVGKLERGASDPSIETVKRLGDALTIDPLMLLSPNLAHLNLLDSAPPEEIKSLPFNPLDIEIMNSLPYPMGIVSRKGTPVYINDMFVETTGIDREEISDNKLWELPIWSLAKKVKNLISKVIVSFDEEPNPIKFVLSLESSDPEKVNLSFYPSPRDRKMGERGMWIFEFRREDEGDIKFPLAIETISRYDLE
jgi:transcriptional regulator with XRE-family HTH domain